MGAAGLAGLVVAPGLLAACGGDDSGSSAGGTGGGGSGGGGNHTLNLYNWAEYDDPELLKKFGKVERHRSTTRTRRRSRSSTAAGGTSGYDIVVPTGVYIPQMVGRTTCSRSWTCRGSRTSRTSTRLHRTSPGTPRTSTRSARTGARRAGSTTTPSSPTPIKTWNDFIDVATDRRAGRCRCSTPPRPHRPLLLGQRHRLDHRRTPASSTPARTFIVDQLAPHIKAFDSYPGINLTQGNYVLSQVWNGDARQGFSRSTTPTGTHGASARRRPSSGWTTGRSSRTLPTRTPPTPSSTSSSIPENSVQDLEFHGYNTGAEGHRGAASPPNTQFQDMIFFTPEAGGDDGCRRGELSAGSPGRHLQQGEGQGRSVMDRAKAKAGADRHGETPVSAEQRSAPPPRRRRLRTPKFALAIPAWIWYLVFFVVPVMLIVCYCFGYKPPVNGRTDRYRSPFVRRTTTRRSSDTFFKTFRNTFRISIIGTMLCLLIGFPFAYLHRGEGAGQMARRHARARDRAVLDELPHPHDRLADRARTRGVLFALVADDGAPRHADPLPRHARRPCSSASSTTTCR